MIQVALQDNCGGAAVYPAFIPAGLHACLLQKAVRSVTAEPFIPSHYINIQLFQLIDEYIDLRRHYTLNTLQIQRVSHDNFVHTMLFEQFLYLEYSLAVVVDSD